VRDFHEHIFERRSTLSQLAHSPVALCGQAENLFAHIDA
jgi:hypothetical protein